LVDQVSWIERAPKRRRDSEQKAQRTSTVSATGAVDHPGNGELSPAQKTGAAAALQRLEKKREEESHRRVERAQATGDPFQIQAAQEFG
jgi:hypothetical protein